VIEGDDFSSAALVQALLQEAEAKGDRRVQRFFAADVEGGGPLRREEELWKAAAAEELRLLRPAAL